jgi:hypothetical protein
MDERKKILLLSNFVTVSQIISTSFDDFAAFALFVRKYPLMFEFSIFTRTVS